MSKTFVGFGFGPIQGGLFLREAFRSGRFERLVVAEVLPEVVAAVRRNGGSYSVNIATRLGIEREEIRGIEIYNPAEAGDRDKLVSAVADASEIGTALPSVAVYSKGSPSVAWILAEGIRNKQTGQHPSCVVYTGENHNHAAELLERAVSAELSDFAEISGNIQFLNTVIGKMSGIINDEQQIENNGLVRLTDGSSRAFLVEEFNRILITRIRLEGFARGIETFVEKDDLLPFEEAKLYGHNATHALIGYLAHRKGYIFMSEASGDSELVEFAREAFLKESGRGLIARHKGVDILFTAEGYREYAEDLLLRMMNPYLQDGVERIIRDSRRKLGWDDRLIGTMRIALDAGIVPVRFAEASAAALDVLCAEERNTPERILSALWPVADEPPGRRLELKELILEHIK
ncbi:MAG: hypothetical protein JXN60_07435 [Lentisphaerae bacterium]|nr:hypothetical protein [Lentisphaerota bacterium]